TRVMAALAAQAGVNALSVKASAHDGVVDLTGTAPTQAIKSTLLETARNVKGVASLTDHVTLKTP
ncbi:MAG: BON domain-containing protein, partial [Candidatus Eremiobacteraeota bacterium]|nr:BON domain-containing protein [Candidatus Eremiobacteraeota bacterium]